MKDQVTPWRTRGGFSPHRLFVSGGAVTIEWRNKDGTPHYVACLPRELFDQLAADLAALRPSPQPRAGAKKGKR